MSKRPAFQFYPSDWRNDPGLRLCSIAARGLWIEMMCLMHEGAPYGHLTVMGRKVTPDAVARLVGESPAAVKRWIGELEQNEVFSTTEEGVIFSRRMVRDEEVREARAAGGEGGKAHGAKGASHGAKGGRPKRAQPASDPPEGGMEKPPLNPPPSSSSSSPSSEGSVPDGTGAEPPSEDPLAVWRAKAPSAGAWGLAKRVLDERGGLNASRAGEVIGKLKRDHRLTDEELWQVAEATWRANTEAPVPYMAKVAADIAGRRGVTGIVAPDAQRQRAWMAEFVESPNSWRTGDRGPRPGSEGCRVDPEIQREFGVEPFSAKSRSAA